MQSKIYMAKITHAKLQHVGNIAVDENLEGKPHTPMVIFPDDNNKLIS